MQENKYFRKLIDELEIYEDLETNKGILDDKLQILIGYVAGWNYAKLIKKGKENERV